jgi:ParB-like chromosome segregation protein Spo0J
MTAAPQIETRYVEKLIPYARNARLHTDAHVAQIAASIQEWGWTFPVLVDENDGIIAGHGRVLAARKLNQSEVPVLVARGWSEAKKRAYVLADNKLALNSKWDPALLTEELRELRDVFATELTGFSADEIEKLFAKGGPPTEFESYDTDTLGLEHECPKCGFRF